MAGAERGASGHAGAAHQGIHAGQGAVCGRRLHPPPKEPTDAEYPLLFTTGRHYARYNFSSMTGKTSEIDDIASEALAEVNPVDAECLGMKELQLTSRRGSVLIRGTIFTTYNYQRPRSTSSP